MLFDAFHVEKIGATAGGNNEIIILHPARIGQDTFSGQVNTADFSKQKRCAPPTTGQAA